MMFRGARRLLLAAVAVSVLAGACTSNPPGEVAPSTAASPTAPSSAAGDLRLTLERRFALHAHLLAEAAGAAPAKAKAAAEAAVDANIEALADVLATAYGQEAAADFAVAMRAHAQALADDPTSVDEAERALAAVLSDVTDETMDPEATQTLFDDAGESLVEAVEAAADGDADAAYAARRRAFASMLDVGRAFAAGITEHRPDAYPGPRSTGALELRSALDQLLTEHAGLAVTMMRRGATGAKDFPAAAAALNGNTEDLVRALRSTYETEVQPFDEAWRARISALADYTVAAAAGDDDARGETRDTLAQADQQVARTLAGLTDGDIRRSRATQSLGRVTDALVRQIDAWIDRDYKAALRAQSQAHERSAAVGDVIAAGIAGHRPEEFPR